MKFKLILVCSLLSVFSACRVQTVSVSESANQQNDKMITEIDERLVMLERLSHSYAADTVTINARKKEINKILSRAVYRQRNIRKYKVLTGNALSRVEERRTIIDLEKLLPTYNKAIQNDIALFSNMGMIKGLEKYIPGKGTRHYVEKKAYYDIGKYVIPYKIKAQALEVYRPMVDSIFKMAERNPKQKTQAIIFVSGYADESPIVDSSELYNDLQFRMGREDITFEEMKMYISYLRAYDISNIIEILIRQKRVMNKGSKNPYIDIEREGFGLSAPVNGINYKKEDERRRTVYVQWMVLGQ